MGTLKGSLSGPVKVELKTPKERIFSAIQHGNSKNIISKISMASATDDLAAGLTKGDNQVVIGRKGIATIIDGYMKAMAEYDAVVQSADKYIEAAKSLGEPSIIKRIEEAKSNAKYKIRECQTAISKAKSI